eukprot:9245273-Pyramimonas_sp.AAC.1
MEKLQRHATLRSRSGCPSSNGPLCGGKRLQRAATSPRRSARSRTSAGRRLLGASCAPGGPSAPVASSRR